MNGIAVLPIVTVGLMLLAIGGIALCVLSLIPSTSRAARSVWPIYVTELGIAGTVFAVFAIGGPLPLLASLLMVLRVTYEATAVATIRMPKLAEMSPLPLAAGCAAAALGLAASALPMRSALSSVVFAGSSLMVLLAVRRVRNTSVGRVLVLLLFPVLPGVAFVSVAAEPNLWGFLLILFILVETNDSYALLGGKLLGRHAAFPRLSPNKTTEGLLAGAVALALTAALVGSWGFGLSPFGSAAIALMACILATAGDLAGSRLKREAGVKDFPLLVPRQGGLLDIVDSWLLTAAVMTAILVLGGWNTL